MELSTLELKFLLRLLEHPPDYRAPISQIKPNPKTSAVERDRVCQSLSRQGLVAYSEEILRYRTTVIGKTLLRLDRSILPATPDELLLLQAAVPGTATPSAARKVSTLDRQRLLHQLQGRGLITIRQSQITEVWLTFQGQEYLRDECLLTGSTAFPGQAKAIPPVR